MLLVLLISVVAVFAAPRLCGIQIYGVLSGSMEPAYSVGDLIYVVPTAEEDIEVGDVISYLLNASGTVATHRVVEIDEENSSFYTKGDANDAADGSSVHYNNVIGVVRFGIPLLGYATMFMSTTSGKILTVTAVIATMILIVLLDILSRPRAKDPAGKEKNEQSNADFNGELEGRMLS